MACFKGHTCVYHSNRIDKTRIPPTDQMATVREEIQCLKRVLNEKRTRLIQEVRELDRTLALIDYLNNNNHQLRTHIQSTNRRQHEGQSQESHRHKRLR